MNGIWNDAREMGLILVKGGVYGNVSVSVVVVAAVMVAVSLLLVFRVVAVL